MTEPAYRRMAGDLRSAIQRGDYQPGSTLPRMTDLAETYGVAKQTAREAIGLLEAEGLVEVVRRRGTVVRERAPRRQITRSRLVYRDDIGYYFDPTAQGWRALSTPVIEWRPCPWDVADLLGVSAGANVFVRDRVMGLDGEPMQLATSYFPEDVARGTAISQPDTGPGGIYDRLEEMGHGPLVWFERVSGRMPTPEEATALRLPPGVPVIRITRTTQDSSGSKVLEVNDTRMSADRFEIGYPIQRDSSAKYPRQ